MKKQLRIGLSVFLCLAPLVGFGHDCSSPGDCEEVVQGTGWFEGVLASIAAIMAYLSSITEIDLEEEDITNCNDMKAALADSLNTIEYHKKLLNGEISMEEYDKKRKVIGLVGVGVVSSTGNASYDYLIEQFENHLSTLQKLSKVWLLIYSFGSYEDFNKAIAKNEIKRQEKFNEYVNRKLKQKGCI